jgi:hypothetical protein
MALYRFKRRVSFVNAYPFSCSSRFEGKVIEVNDVFDERPWIGLGVYPQDFEELPDPRDDTEPTAIAEVVPKCASLLRWIHEHYKTDLWRVVKCRLGVLLNAVAMLPDAPVPPFCAQDISAAENVSDLVMLAKRLRQWAADAEVKSSDESVGMSTREAAERMDRLRKQGEPFPSQHELARQFGCSSATINKAINATPSLQKWAKRKAGTPRAQTLNDALIDRVAQSGEPNPEDEAAIREHLRRDLKPEERDFFANLSRADQLEFLNDPDKHSRILGRKP